MHWFIQHVPFSCLQSCQNHTVTHQPSTTYSHCNNANDYKFKNCSRPAWLCIIQQIFTFFITLNKTLYGWSYILITKFMVDPSLSQRGVVSIDTLISKYFAICYTRCIALQVSQHIRKCLQCSWAQRRFRYVQSKRHVRFLHGLFLQEIETVDSPYFLSLNLSLAAEHLNFTRNLAGLLKNISKKGRFYNFFYLNLRLYNFKWTVAQWQWL